MPSRYPLAWFFAITFAVTWGAAGLAWLFDALGVWSLRAPPADGPVFSPARMRHLLSLHPGVYPLMYFAVWAPTLTGIFVTWAAEGRAGLRDLRGRLLRWRVGRRWWALGLLPFVLHLTALAAAALFTDLPLDQWGQIPLWVVPLFAVIALTGGPLGEEVGWRGFALPRMMRRMSALGASVVLGAVWALWHLPIFVVPGVNELILPRELPFLPVLILLVSASVLLSWVYLNGRQSLLLAILFHFGVASMQLGAGTDADATLLWTSAGTFAAAAALVALFTRGLGPPSPA